MAGQVPAFDGSRPPLLAEHTLETIYSNPVIVGPKETSTALYGIPVWDWVGNAGARANLMGADDVFLYTGIITRSGEFIPNTDRGGLGGIIAPYVNVGSPQLALAQVTRQREWHLMAGPDSYSKDTTREVRESFLTELSTLKSFQSTLEASVEASTSASGFGMEASVTVGLKETVSEGVEQQETISTEREVTLTEGFKAGFTYAEWGLFERIEIEVVDPTPVGPWRPLNDAQIAAVNPGKQTYMTLRMHTQDFAETALMPR